MFKVGDRVKNIMNGFYRAEAVPKGSSGKIIFISDGAIASVKFKGYPEIEKYALCYLEEDKSPKTIRDVEVGDIIYNTEAVYKNVMAISGRLVALSCDNHLNKDFVGSWQSMESLERGEWKIKGQGETITIADKTYNKADVEKRLAELTPIE